MSVRKYSDFPETPPQMAARAEELSRRRHATLKCDLRLEELYASVGALSNASEPHEFFQLLKKQGIRFRGATVEFIFGDHPESPIGVIYNVPPVFMCKAAWFMDRDPSSHIVLGVESGVAVRDIDLVEDIDVLRRTEVVRTLYPEYGFAWVAVLVISKTPDGAVALYLYGGSADAERPSDDPLSDGELFRLEKMCRPIAEAIERMGLPRGCRPGALQRHITERSGPPERAAYIIQTQDGAVIEGSSLALQVVNAYLPPASWKPEANPFSSLVPLESIAADASHDWHQQRHSNPVGELLVSGRSIRYTASSHSQDAMKEVLITLSHQIDPAIRWLAAQKPPADAPAPLDIFIASAPEDASHVEDLTRHMAVQWRRGLITYWHPGLLLPGDVRTEQIHRHLGEAQILIALLSAHFLASEDCDKILLAARDPRAPRRPRIVPILVRPCVLDGLPFADLELLPRNKVAVVQSENSDEDWAHIVREVLQLKASSGRRPVNGVG